MTDPAPELSQALADPQLREAAARALVDTYGPRLHARARALVGAADADDVFQDALAKIIVGAASFDRRSAFGTWCYRVTTNVALDHLRARRRRPRHETLADSAERLLAADSDLPTPATIEALVGEAMAQLPARQLEIFTERYFHETPYAELARRLGRSEGALKASFHHATRKVADYLRTQTPIHSA